MKQAQTHEGHRERLREEFKASGAEGWDDHRLLEMFLFAYIPRKDTNEIAHALLDAFGSLRDIINADWKELKKNQGHDRNRRRRA